MCTRASSGVYKQDLKSLNLCSVKETLSDGEKKSFQQHVFQVFIIFSKYLEKEIL